MANLLPTRPRQITQRRTLGIVSSQYNLEFTKGLVEHATAELRVLVPGAALQHIEVPGAFEIPLAVQELAARGGFDAIIALGVIIEGETEHAALIAAAVTNALMESSLKLRIPVVHEVLHVRDAEQARKRCLDESLNRGTEAARVAVRMLQSLAEIKAR